MVNLKVKRRDSSSSWSQNLMIKIKKCIKWIGPNQKWTNGSHKTIPEIWYFGFFRSLYIIYALHCFLELTEIITNYIFGRSNALSLSLIGLHHGYESILMKICEFASVSLASQSPDTYEKTQCEILPSSGITSSEIEDVYHSKIDE